jgi:hypothetical protein
MRQAKTSSNESKAAPGWSTMLQGDVMKTAPIVGIILMALGFASLAYVALPMRLMMQVVQQQNSSPLIPILGGLVLLSGIALLLTTEIRCRR